MAISLRKTIYVGLLRLITGAAQFAVIIFITRVFSLAEVGQYSIFVIVLGYFSQLAGLSFYTHVMRELAGHPMENWPKFLMQQWWFLGVSIVAVAVLAAAIFEVGLFQIHHVSYFLILLALAVVNSQHENFLVGTGHPVYASLSLLLRSVWILPLTAFYYLNAAQMDMSAVYLAWASAEGVAAAFVLFMFSRLGLWPPYSPINRSWIVGGMQVGARYTLLGLVLLLTVSAQRVLLAQTHGDEVVGIFHFFYVVSVFLPNLLEASLFAVLLPKLILQHKSLGGSNFGPPKSTVFGFLLGIGAVGLATIGLSLPLVVSLLDKSELLEYRQVFLYTAGYALLYTASRAFHYQLYASSRDALLVKANLISCAGSCISALVLIPYYGLNGAAMSLLVAGAIMFAAFGWPFFRLKHA